MFLSTSLLSKRGGGLASEDANKSTANVRLTDMLLFHNIGNFQIMQFEPTNCPIPNEN